MSDYTPISMIRGSSTVVDSTPIVDGQILFDETRKCLFMDNGSTREKYSGLGADSNIANVEDTTTASQPYTTGEFVVVEGQLYKVTASIAQGDTFSVGTNIATDTVGSELTKINADLTEVSTALSNIKYFPNYDDVIVNPVPNGGYTVPRDGYLVGYVANSANIADIKINNTRIAYDNTGTNRYACAQCLVAKGDVITFTATQTNLILVGLKQSE